MTRVTVGSVELKERLDSTTDFTGFYFNKLTEWYSLPQSKAENTARPNAHGSFGGGTDWRDAAVPSVAGGFVGADEVAALTAMDTLKRAWAQGAQVDMTVEDSLRATTRSVSIRFLTIPDHHGQRHFEFILDALARDPRRYGAAQVASNGLPVTAGGLVWPITYPITWGGGGNDGRITLTNTGTADGFPLLEVAGGLGDGFTIDEVGSGRQVRFDRVVPLGSTVYLNPRTGRAYIDQPTNDVSGYLTRSDWPSVPAGGQTVLQFNGLGAVTGTPTLTGRFSPPFW